MRDGCEWGTHVIERRVSLEVSVKPNCLNWWPSWATISPSLWVKRNVKAQVTSIKSDKKVILIEGARLAALMIEHNLGVPTAQTFALKRLDTDFFEED